MLRSIALCLIVLSLTACSILSQKRIDRQKMTLDNPGGGDVIATLPVQLRVITMRNGRHGRITCAEPSPDVAMSDTYRWLASASRDAAANTADGQGATSSSTAKVAATSDLQAATAALALSGRTQTVLLAREMMFRVCEGAANGWINEKQVVDLDTKIIGELGNMVAADKTQADAEKTRADAQVTAASAAVNAGVLTDTGAVLNKVICASQLQQCIQSAGSDTTKTAQCQSTYQACK